MLIPRKQLTPAQLIGQRIHFLWSEFMTSLLHLKCLVHVPILSRLAARQFQRIEFTIPTQTIDRSQTRSIYLSVRRRPTFTFD